MRFAKTTPKGCKPGLERENDGNGGVMELGKLTLFDVVRKRLAWLGQRQDVITPPLSPFLSESDKRLLSPFRPGVPVSAPADGAGAAPASPRGRRALDNYKLD